MSKRTLSYIAPVLVAIILTSIFQPLASLKTFADQAAQGNCRTFPENGKTTCGKFLDYWNTHGGLAQQGLPLSGEFTEKSELNGQSYTVQYFERAVFELHPENAGTQYEVLLSQLGTFQGKSKYPNGFPGAGAPPPPTSGNYQIGQSAQIKPGVTIVFRGVEVDVVGKNTTWRGTVLNGTTSTFKFQASADATSMRDSAGRSFGLNYMLPHEADIPAQGNVDIRIGAGTGNEPVSQYVELTMTNIAGAGPFTWRSPVPPQAPPKVYQLNEKVEIRPGVTIEFRSVELGQSSTWRGVILNQTNSAFKFQASADATSMRDSAGRSFGLNYMLPHEANIPAQGNVDIRIGADTGTTALDKYIELNIYNISGAGPFTWRKNLP